MPIANNSVNVRNNPTANRSLQKVNSNYNVVKTSISDLKDLNILCTKCTVFEGKDKALNKIYMRHDERNELYQCPNCNSVTSERQIKYAMRLELPEFIYYDKTKDIKDVKKQREQEEKFIIQPINSQSPTDLLKKVGVRAVRNTPPSRTELKK